MILIKFPSFVRSVFGLTVLALSSSVASGQSWTNGRLTVRATSTVADSLLDYAKWPSTRFVRRSDGKVLVGALPEATIVRLLSADLRQQQPFMRRGQGPAEADAAMLNIHSVSGNRVMVSSFDPPRSTLFDTNGKIESEALGIRMPDGAGVCGTQMFASGWGSGEGPTSEGLYKICAGSNPQKVYSLNRPNQTRGYYQSQLMDVANGRILVGRPHSPFVVISNASCEGFTEVVVRLSWFRERNVTALKEERQSVAPDTVLRNVHWYDATRAMLLIVRPTKFAKPRTIEQSRRALGNITPADGRPTVETVETVLVVFDVATGAVLSELALPRIGWSFLSNRELVQHNTNPDNEWYQVYSIALRAS